MIVKSAALSSNQAVGVKKSLDISNENQAAGVYQIGEPWIGKPVGSNGSQIGEDKVVVVHLLSNLSFLISKLKQGPKRMDHQTHRWYQLLPLICILEWVLQQPRWTWCLAGSHKSHWAQPEIFFYTDIFLCNTRTTKKSPKCNNFWDALDFHTHTLMQWLTEWRGFS